MKLKIITFFSAIILSFSSFSVFCYSTFVVSMKFMNNAVGSLLGSYDTSYAYSNSHYVEINGSKGRILIEDQVKNLLSIKKIVR
mgnify:CR=1 FL=1